MTKRLYYDDARTLVFDAQITGRVVYENRPALVLDRSYFYPTSGGQPNDLGTLNGAAVIDVVVSNGTVLHVMAANVEGEQAHGVIDAARRLDHTRHHSGQHILSQAFLRVCEAETVGFHLTGESVTVDIEQYPISESDLDRVETLANEIVMANLPVRTWFPPTEELATLSLRKIPEKAGDHIRVVDIGNGFDVVACGGTHVRQTGEIGIIKIVRTEKSRNHTRVQFACAERALLDYREKNLLINLLSSMLTTTPAEFGTVYERLREENKLRAKESAGLRAELMTLKAEQLWQVAKQRGGDTVLVYDVFENMKAEDLRAAAARLAQFPHTVALLAATGEKAQFMFARSPEPEHNMAQLLQIALVATASATGLTPKGGGKPEMAQGGGVPASLEQVKDALEQAVRESGLR